MIEQAAAALPPVSTTSPALAVSVTLSAGAIITAIGALLKVTRWMGHVDAIQGSQTERLDEIRDDVRELRRALLPTKRGE